jgi:ABC-type methionine transport system ATPase subunit
MAKRILKLTFPEHLVKAPLTFQMAKQFDLVPNIRRARVTETAGELVLELEGVEKDIEQGIQFLEDEGVQVTAAEGDVLE